MLNALNALCARWFGGRGSLSTHYCITAMSLSVLVFLGLWAAQAYVVKAGRLSSVNIEQRHQAAVQSRVIRNDVWRLEASLHGWLDSNDSSDQRKMRLQLDGVIREAGALSNQPWVRDNAREPAQALIDALTHLRSVLDNTQRRVIGEQHHTVLRPVWEALQSFDQTLDAAGQQDLGVLNQVARTITMGLCVLGTVMLLTIGAGYLYFNRTVLRPIAQVTHALHAEAKGVDGTELPDDGTVETRELIDAFLEMRHQVHSRQVALEYQALHDALTGLPNRTLLQDRLQQVVHAARRDQRPLALIMMDLDRFKEINDTLGHHVGDRILQQVGERLGEVLRETDTVARLGGDEFALLLPHAHEQHAAGLARKIVAALEQVFSVEHHQLYVGASLGIACYPEHGDNAETLIQRADVAMYVAKRNNSGYAFYNPGQDEHSVGRLALVGDLHNALHAGGLELHYQPKLHIAGGRVIGCEALLRWRHPQRGFVPPDEIIPIAEQTGMIQPLTQWVLNTALGQCAAWRRAGLDLPVAVNLSVWNLHDREFDRLVADLLARWELPASYLELEITESAMVADPDMDMLKRLHTIGVKLAVDDYGTGFSSLAYLKNLPLNEIKIDKSFVMDMITDENDAVIVRSTIDLAHNLGRRVVAEGVESKEIWDLLEILRCDTAQGYYISKPLPAAELERWLQESSWCAPDPEAVRA